VPTASGTALWERNPTWVFFPQARKEGRNLQSTLGWKGNSVNGPEVHLCAEEILARGRRKTQGPSTPPSLRSGSGRDDKLRQEWTRLVLFVLICLVLICFAAKVTSHPRESLGEEVVEGADGGEFVVFDVEDGVELGDVEDVLDLLGEVEELEFSAGVADGGEAADEFTDAGAVDVVDTLEVEDDFFLALGDEAADGVAEVADFVAEDDASGDVEEGDVSDFAGLDG